MTRTTNSVAILRLHVHADARDRATAREGAERFARRVIDAACEALEARAPGRAIVIPRLAARWSCTSFDDGDAIAECAEEMARAIERLPPLDGLVVPGGADAIVFEDEAHLRAAALLARARGEHAAWHAAAAEDECSPVEALVRLGDDVAGAVARRLDREGALAEVLSALGDAELATLARAVDPADAVAPGRAASVSATAASLVDVPATGVRAAPGDRATDPPWVAAIRGEMAVRARARARGAPTGDPRASQSPALVGDRTAAADERGVPASLVSGEPPRDGRERHATRFGGAAYLLSLALELNVGEMLWEQCIPEDAALAAALGALLGPGGDDDPLVRLLAGRGSLGTVGDDQQRAIARELLAAFAAAVPHRGLAELSALRVHRRVAGDARAPLLLATASHERWPVFARPAATAEALRAGARDLLAAWPAHAPPLTAEGALAAAMNARRVRAAPAGVRRDSPPPFVAGVPGLPPVVALVTQLAGTLAELFRARIGVASLDHAALVEGWLRVPGEVTADAESIVLTIPAERYDPALRRAGVDRDPGWVPWLERRVRLDFGGEEY